MEKSRAYCAGVSFLAWDSTSPETPQKRNYPTILALGLNTKSKVSESVPQIESCSRCTRPRKLHVSLQASDGAGPVLVEFRVVVLRKASLPRLLQVAGGKPLYLCSQHPRQ